MATDNSNKQIIKNDESFPPWLNFDKLRSEGIDHIAKLSGNIWTDHNVHDPGITILEMLCYALMDLGYRTSLPPIDLFAQDPDKVNAKDFFTGAEILSNNPLTILDYRRMLIDIPGVRNAWLEVDDWLNGKDAQGTYVLDEDRDPCNLLQNRSDNKYTYYSFLNGLYHVYVELEDNTAAQKEDIKDKIKKALLSHRNLCEDFIDLVVLCKQEIGICATIELEQSADAEKVYQQIIERLTVFFSPSPKFYTIQALLNKGRTIEEIHAGRPYDIQESHGFVDVDELESIKLKKEIHLSDVYQVILEVKGVVAVRNLTLRDCKGKGCTDPLEDGTWLFKLFRDHVPQFNPACSGLTFIKNGVPAPVNTEKHKAYFSLGFSATAKAVYPKSSPYLDLALPKGIYRSDLDSYYSIQNEFPQVYKIGNGQLLSDTPAERRAMALQLKGFLLFFDHLLANYVTQLKSVRSLLSLSQEANDDGDTSSSSNLSTVPDLNLLVRFSKEQLAESGLHAGSILAYPADRNKLLQLLAAEEVEQKDIEQLKPYLFRSPEAASIVVNQLSEDLSNDHSKKNVFQTKEGNTYFYIDTSADVVLLSKKNYPTGQAALKDADAVMFAAASQNNFYSYPLPDEQSHTFYLSFGPAGSLDYLRFISNDKSLFNKRKQQFLDHLLSRFAEKFTDFAMLTHGFADENAIAKGELVHKQKFLQHYPELSGNRGKAYDYSTNGWDNLNISGVEKRFKALAGIANWKKSNHCHFDVVPYEKEMVIHIAHENFNVLKGVDKLDEADATDAFHSLVNALADRGNYHCKDQHSIYVKDGHYRFEHPGLIEDVDEAIDRLYRLFSQLPYRIEPAIYEHLISIYNSDEAEVLRRIEPVKHASQDLPVTDELLHDVNDTAVWHHLLPVGEIMPFLNPSSPASFADLAAFNVDAYSFDIRKEYITHKFSISNRQDSPRFLFHSVHEFGSREMAILMGRLFLFTLADIANYDYEENEKGQYNIIINRDGPFAALESIEHEYQWQAQAAAQRIRQYASEQIYHLHIRPDAKAFRFLYPLGFTVQAQFLFTSRNEDYESYEAAYTAARHLTTFTDDLTAVVNDANELEIIAGTDVLAYYKLSTGEDPAGAQQHATALLKLKSQMNRLVQKPSEQEHKYILPVDPTVRFPAYIYRLYDKNNSYAYYKLPEGKPEAAAVKKQLFKKYPRGYHILEICYGGDIVHERINSRTQWPVYHYQVKSRNHYYPGGEELVLFESIKGYASEAEAEEAFNEHYMTILTKALDDASYGTFIGFSETDVDVTAEQETVVFIPAETMMLYGNHNDHARKELVQLAGSYPVRAVKKCSDEFKKLFKCDHSCPEDAPAQVECGKQAEEKDVYYFVLSELLNDSLQEAWYSDRYFDTAQEAFNAFRFFVPLLGYKGNYHVELDCDCGWRVNIREILVVSHNKFARRRDAWCGIEKFIEVSQSNKAFHKVQHQENCCYSFYVSCNNPGIIHPCVYRNPQLRDVALRQLQKAGIENYFDYRFEGLHNEEILDFLAKLNVTNEIKLHEVLMDVESGFAFSGQGNYKDIPISEELKQNLKEAAYYFPVKKKNDRFYVELRYPGFGKHHLKNVRPCTCGKRDNIECTCNIAWKSECDFEKPGDAIMLFDEIRPCLRNPENYKAVFDDNCNEYRILLHCTKNQPVAYNPQCYSIPRQVAQAVQQTKALINNEGLHLVEHILLRPAEVTKCKDAAGKTLETDCLTCTDVIPPYAGKDKQTCELEEDCWFSWPAPAEYDKSKILFTPGHDPYSFLATVVLPAWPERFRKPENRLLLERMLYREAPAHVMLRIIWLRPRNMCMFEKLFRNWNRYMADKKLCSDGPLARKHLVTFLFKAPLSCLANQDPCPACVTPEANDPCGQKSRITKVPYDLLDAVNELFCWKNYTCGAETVQILKKHAPPPKAQQQQQPPQQMAQMMQSYAPDKALEHRRVERYRRSLKNLLKQTGNLPLAETSLKFVKDPNPSRKLFVDLCSAVLAVLTHDQSIDAAQATVLMSNIVSAYLDRQLFKDSSIAVLSAAKEELSDLRKRGVNMAKVYDSWKPNEIEKLVPPADREKVYHLLTGTKLK